MKTRRPPSSRLPRTSRLIRPRHLSQELKRKYLNAHAPAEEFSPHDDDASREPRPAALYPSSGPRGCATALSVRGELLGRAVTHGEITLSALLPRASRPVDIPATFVSDTKLECVLPPSEHPGVAHLSLARAKATLTPLSPSATAASAAAAAAAPALPAGTCAFHVYGPFAASRLRPPSGPVSGGTAVRVLGSGFAPTGELTVRLRMRGAEQRVPAAFISETELRFMTPDFHDAGDAQVHVSLNGQQFAEDPELTFTFVAPACAIA